MEAVLAFGVLWVVLAGVIVILRDKWAALALLALNLTIAGFLLTENDVVGAALKGSLGIIAPVIVILAAARTREPESRHKRPTLILGIVLTIALSYLAAFIVQPDVPAGLTAEAYALTILFGIAFLIIISQKSVLKLLLGILVLENVGTLLLAWGQDTALLTALTEIFVVLITLTVAIIAVLDFREYETVDSTKLTNLRG